MKFRARWMRLCLHLSSVPFLMLCLSCSPDDGGSTNDVENQNTANAVPRIFPVDYELTFVEVAGCHDTPSHGGAHTRTFANAEAVSSYLASAAPFLLGSVVIKVEYSAPGCAEEDLTGWAAIRKEAPGSNPDAGDWHWQLVLSDVGVLHNDEATCIGCHSELECLARDYTCATDRRGSES